MSKCCKSSGYYQPHKYFFMSFTFWKNKKQKVLPSPYKLKKNKLKKSPHPDLLSLGIYFATFTSLHSPFPGNVQMCTSPTWNTCKDSHRPCPQQISLWMCPLSHSHYHHAHFASSLCQMPAPVTSTLLLLLSISLLWKSYPHKGYKD